MKLFRAALASTASALAVISCSPSFAQQQPINIGSAANDGTGDSLRTAFAKVNSNFAGTLQKANNLSDVASQAAARISLGLGSASTQAASAFDPAGAAATVQAGLGSAAFQPSSAFDLAGAASSAQGSGLQKSSNLGDLTSAATARTNLGLGSAATLPSTAFDTAGAAAGVQASLGSAAAQPATAFDVAGSAASAQASSLQKAGNLGDLTSAATARTNLGLGSAAIQPSSAFDPAGAAASAVAGISLTGTLQKSNNLSDVASPLAARTNLGLGSASTQASTAFDAAGAAAAVQAGLGSAASQPVSAFDAAGAASTAQGASLQKSSNLSDLGSAVTARANLGLGSASTLASSAFDPAGAAAAVQVTIAAPQVDLNYEAGSLTGALTAASTTPRPFTDPFIGSPMGAAVEGAVTNQARSTEGGGGVAGTTTLPTSWNTNFSAAGMTATDVGTTPNCLTVAGVSYACTEIKIVGTPTSGGTYYLHFGGLSGAGDALTAGNVEYGRIWAKCSSYTGVSGLNAAIVERTSSGGYVGQTSPVAPFAPQSDIFFPMDAIRTIATTGDIANPAVTMVTTASTPVNVDCQFAAVQMETSSIPHTYVPATTVDGTRAADTLQIANAPLLFGSLGYTFTAKVHAAPLVATGTLLQLDDGTGTSNRIDAYLSAGSLNVEAVSAGTTVCTTNLGPILPWVKTTVSVTVQANRLLVALGGGPATAVACSASPPVNITRAQIGNGNSGAFNGYIAEIAVPRNPLAYDQVASTSLPDGVNLFDNFQRANTSAGSLGSPNSGQNYTLTANNGAGVVQMSLASNLATMAYTSAGTNNASYTSVVGPNAARRIFASGAFTGSGSTHGAEFDLISTGATPSLAANNQAILNSSHHHGWSDSGLALGCFANGTLTGIASWYYPAVATPSTRYTFGWETNPGSLYVTALSIDGTWRRAYATCFATAGGLQNLFELYEGTAASDFSPKFSAVAIDY